MIACGLHIGAITCQYHLKGGHNCIKGVTVRAFRGDVMACAAWYVALQHTLVVLYCILYITFV